MVARAVSRKVRGGFDGISTIEGGIEMRTLTIVIALLGLALLASTGCKNKEEKVCEHLKGFVDNGNYSAEECKGDLADYKKNCSNPDDIFDCFLAAGKEDDLDKCEEKCKQKQ
jgi:hypothetical protein